MTVTRAELAMAGAAVALVVDSFLPWYDARWSSMRYGTGQTVQYANTASAWAASTGWSVGIVLALAAAAAWLLWPRQRSRGVRIGGTAVVALAAVVTTVGTWLVARTHSTGGSTTLVPATADGPRPSDIVRDVLSSGTLGWGFYLGVLLMLTIAACPFAGQPRAHVSADGDGAS